MLLHEEQQRAVEQILSSYDGRMSKIISEIERLLNRYILSNQMSTTNALKFDIEFDRILTQAGYYALVNRMIDNDFDELFTLISDGFAAGGVAIKYTTDDLNKVMALKELVSNKFSVVGSTAGTTLRENLYKYALSNYSLEDMQSRLMEDFRGTNMVRHSKTLANTAIKEFQESMIDISAEGLDGVWLYVGVKDSQNRDFCRCVLSKNAYYDDDEKNKLKYDKDRQYNCRHRFRMVTEDYATPAGYKKSTGVSC